MTGKKRKPVADEIETFLRRATDLSQRFLRGSLDPAQVLVGMQMLIEGKPFNGDTPIPAGPPAAKPNLPRPAAGLLERPTRFTAPLGEFKTAQDLIGAIKGAGLAYIEPFVLDTLLPGITLCQEKGEAGVVDVNPGDFGNTRPPKFDAFYDTQIPAQGFGRPVREWGALWILKLQRQLDETGDCDLKVGQWFAILSDPLKVDARGSQFFLCVGRHRDGLYLYCDWLPPADEIDLGYPCLVSGK